MKRKGFAIDGVLLLDKPSGLTSNAALQRAKRLLGAAKAGHTGTLDPLATGLLPLCFGEATKLAGYLLDADKTYLAGVLLGAATDTGDAEGSVIFRGDARSVCRAHIEEVLSGLVGEMFQVPPMYSALKRAGRPLYDYARAGETVEREPRRVRIHSLELCGQDGDRLDIRARVSKGTYIRVLAQEIGERLGCGAHLVALRREETGGMHVDHAITLDQLEQTEAPARPGLLQPVDSLAPGLPRLELSEASAVALQQGQVVGCPRPLEAGIVRLYAPANGFFGVGEVDQDGRLRAKRLMALPTEAVRPQSTSPNSLGKLEENS